MRVVNKTKLNTEDLENFLHKGLEALVMDPRKVKRVDVRYGKYRHTRGWAYCDKTKRIEIAVPRSFCGHGGCLTELAQIWEHELQHLVWGLDHDAMVEWYLLPVKWRWQTGLTIRTE